MKKKIKNYLIFFLIFYPSLCLIGQEIQHENLHHANKGTIRLSVGLGHTHVSEGKIDGKTEWLALPSWSLNFDYWFANKWAVGLQNDLVLESFFIENENNEIIERSYPIATVPVVLFKPGKRVTFLAGIGAEFTSDDTLTLTRIGIEYGFHLPKKWEIGIALVWDNKWDYYNSWGLAVTVSKLFNNNKL